MHQILKEDINYSRIVQSPLFLQLMLRKSVVRVVAILDQRVTVKSLDI